MRIAAESFRGEAPRVTPRELPANGAQVALNARLQSGDLEAWRQFVLNATLLNSEAVQTIYRLNGEWLSWAVDADVARGAIAGDSTFRAYITAPALYEQPRFTNFALATTGAEPFPVITRPLGVPGPESAPSLAAGVSTLPSSNTTEVLDNGDEFTSSWSASSPVITAFTRSFASESGLVGNDPPSYYLQADENASIPAYLFRDFGMDDVQVVEVSFDFLFNAAPRKRMFANILVSSTGAGLCVAMTETGGMSIGLIGGFDIRGFSTLASVATPVPSDSIWYTCKVQVITNPLNTRTVTATLYLDSVQIATVTATNSFVNRGGIVGFVSQVAEPTGPDPQTYYDNILVRGTNPTDALTQTATSYVYTFVNDLGEESAPSPPSVTTLKDDGTAITVTSQVGVQSGFGDYGVTTKRIYRAVTGNTGTVFRFVAETLVGQADYVDELADKDLGEVLESDDWDLPPDDLRGILALPNGIMAGFRRNQLCFSAQNRPHAWPILFRLNTDTEIVAIGNIDNTVVIGTEAFPYLATGNDPAAYSMSKLEKPQACVAKRSLAYLTGIGVVFASPDGLIAISGNGRVANLTESIFTRRQWQDLVPETIVGAAHDDVYFFFPEGSRGFALDMKPTGFGLIELGFHAIAMYADPLTDSFFLALDAVSEPSEAYLPIPSSEPVLSSVSGVSLYTETFDEGLTPYTLTSGSVTRFSIVSTPYGVGLDVVSVQSNTVDRIVRDVPARTATALSAKFKVTDTGGGDDAPTVIWASSSGAVAEAFLIPVRETALDSARRAHLTIGAEEMAVTTSVLATDVWYQFNAILSAVAGETTAEIVRLSDGVVIGAVTFALAHPPSLVDSLVFVRDSGFVATAGIVYDDVSIGRAVEGNGVFEFDSPDAYGDMAYRWRGKLNLLPHDNAFCYCQVKAADFENLILNLYADGVLLFTQTITSQAPFTLPMSDDYRTFELELVGTSRVYSVQVTDDITELQ